MKKTIYLLVVLAAIMGNVLTCCNGDGSGEGSNSKTSGDTNQIDSTEYPQMSDYVVSQPEKVKAYIDASGSMRGYFSKGSDGRFISAISNSKADETVWMDDQFTPIKGSLNTAVQDGTFQGADSRFDMMIQRIREDLELDSIANLGLLFTDGIISSSVAQTQKDPKHTIKSFTELKNAITEELKNRGLAVSLFRLESKFDGHYWNYQNQDAGNVVIQNRPFYVIAIGSPEVVRYFNTNNKLNAEFESWGLFNDVNKKKENKYVLTPYNASDWKGREFKGKKDIKFSLPLPKYVCDLGWDYIKKNTIVELNDNDITKDVDFQPDNSKSISSVQLSWNTDRTENAKAPVLYPQKDNEFTVKIVKNDSSSFYTDSLSCEDDSLIATDSVLQKQTFGLKYLREGLREGVGEGVETVIFKVQKKFKVTN